MCRNHILIENCDSPARANVEKITANGAICKNPLRRNGGANEQNLVNGTPDLTSDGQRCLRCTADRNGGCLFFDKNSITQ